MAFSNVDAPLSSSCLSINTIFTLMVSGVGVTVKVAVADGVMVGVKEGVEVGLVCCVIVGVREDVAVALADGVNVDVLKDIILGIGEDVTAFVAVVDGVKVGVIELVTVGGALVTVDVDVDVIGSGISEGVEEIVAVALIVKGVSLGMDVLIDSGEARGIWMFNKGADGCWDFENREKAISTPPAITNTPKTEKAVRARTVFCWRTM